jgi:hypothetical protein
MAKTTNSVKSLEIPIYFHNYKLLEDKEFVLKGSNIYFIQGPNKVGKTSFLKALQSLMIANDDTADKVTRGSDETEGYYETTIPAADGTLLTIRHEFTADGKGKFFAIREDGTKISQVTEIRRLFNYTPINVNEFFAWSNSADGRKKQRDVILRLLPDSDREAFNELDLQEQHYYTQRTEVNRLVDQAKSNIAAIVIPKEDEALIPREKEAKDLVELYQHVKDARKLIPDQQLATEELKRTSTRLEKEIEEKKKELDRIDLLIAKGEEATAEIVSKIAKYAAISDEDLNSKIIKGNEIITKITSLSTKTGLKKEWEDKFKTNEKASEDLTNKIETCRTHKAEIVSGSDLPVENIDFEDGYLTIDGFQFKENQICESDAVLILANILARINPGPIQIIGDASVLDAEKLEMLNKIAEDNNKVMFVDEVRRDANDMVVVGYEDLVKADLEENFKKLDGKKKEAKPKKEKKVEKEPHGPEVQNDGPSFVDNTPGEGDNEPETLF